VLLVQPGLEAVEALQEVGQQGKKFLKRKNQLMYIDFTHTYVFSGYKLTKKLKPQWLGGS
jgi:hypothetical protein